MDFACSYLQRQNYSIPEIPEPPVKGTGIIVVIPCFHEPGIRKTLRSLFTAWAPLSGVEILLIYNYPEGTDKETISGHERSRSETEVWVSSHHHDKFRCRVIDLGEVPCRIAGAGYARKAGMDLALKRFAVLEYPRGIIVSLDADVICDPGYFTEIERHFMRYPGLTGCTINFEHLLSGSEFPVRIYQGIIKYELHLRYHVQALRSAGFPYAYHTIGSCFAVTAQTYAAQGGMNIRKAGEDFYFLQKVIPNGHFRELNSTVLYLSPRPSGRVIFGTGPQMIKWMEGETDGFFTYNFRAYLDLKALFGILEEFYRPDKDRSDKKLRELSPDMQTFLAQVDFQRKILEINANVASLKAFRKRFFSWFHALMVVKFLNFMHKDRYKKQPVRKAVMDLFSELGLEIPLSFEEMDLLIRLRELDRQSEYESGM